MDKDKSLLLNGISKWMKIKEKKGWYVRIGFDRESF